MFKSIFLPLIVSVTILALSGCDKDNLNNQSGAKPKPGARIITFAGEKWEVRTSSEEPSGPGPNIFSDSKENVWVDSDGKLHLKITMRNGKWICAGVTLLKSYGYGKYIFELDSHVDRLDKNVVNGLFLYENDEQEVDIEFSKWSIAENMDAQYATQPSEKNGNKKRFFLNNTNKQSVHWIYWKPNAIDFASYRGRLSDTANDQNIIQKWTYAGSDIPKNRDETVKINLWLFKGMPPSNKKETEVVLSGFKVIK